jgi:hypothetical protein
MPDEHPHLSVRCRRWCACLTLPRTRLQQLLGPGNVGPIQLGTVSMKTQWRYCNSLTGCSDWKDDSSFQNLVFSYYNSSSVRPGESYRYIANPGMQFYLSVSPTQFVLQSGWTSGIYCSQSWAGLTASNVYSQGSVSGYQQGSNQCAG